MNTLPGKFHKVEWHTFIFGTTTDDGFSQMVATAEAMGCEFIQAIGGMMNPPGSTLAIPGSGPRGPVPVLRLVARCPRSEWEKVGKMITELASGVQS